MLDDVGPQTLGGVDHLLVVQQTANLGDGGGQVQQAHGVAFGMLLVEDRLVLHEVLERHVQVGVELRTAGGVLLVEELRVGAAHADEPCGQIEPAAFAGRLVQASQGKLNFRVPVRAVHLAFAITEIMADAIRHAFGDVQGTLGAGDLVMGHGGFDEMAHGVELMAPAQAFEALLGR